MNKYSARFEVQTRMGKPFGVIAQWDNVNYVNGELEYFATIADAQNDINEFILEQREAVEDGFMSDSPDPEDYRIFDRVEQCVVSVGDSFTDRLYAELTSIMRFVAYWGAGYGERGSGVFTLLELESKYEDESEVYEFHGMAVGEIVDLSDLSGIHFVMRVE